MKQLDVFVDESGNTGDAAHLAAAFGGQPSFALAGLGEEADSETFSRLLRDMRRRYRIQAPELKAKTVARRPQIAFDIVTEMRRASCPIFIELMDKQYYLATNLVSHFLGRPWLDMSSEECRTLANGFADLLTTQLPLKYLLPYVAFALEPSDRLLNECAQCLRDGISLASRWAPPAEVIGLRMMREALDLAMADYLREANGNPIAYLGMLPPPDLTTTGMLKNGMRCA